MKLIYVGLTFFVLVPAELKPLNTESQHLNVNINDLVDSFIPQVSQLIIDHGLDPLVLPRIETRLWKAKLSHSPETAKMLYKADLSLFSGILNHLSVLERHNDIVLTYEEATTNKAVTMNGSFKFNNLKGEYRYILDIGIVNFSGTVIIKVTDVRIKMNVIFDTTKYSLLLDKLELENVGSIKVEVGNENGAVSWIKTAIVNFILPYFKNTIMNNVQGRAISEIQNYFDEINSKIAPKVLSQFFNGTYLQFSNFKLKNFEEVVIRITKPSNIKLENHELELSQKYTVENR